jgi:hypothetical protein
MSLILQVTLQPFDKWMKSFIGPLNPPTWRSKASYIIITTNYLTRWEEVVSIKDYNMKMIV